METISKRSIWIFFLSLITIMVIAYLLNIFYGNKPGSLVEANDYNDYNSNRANITTILDEQGQLLLATGLPVFTKDEYINEKNIHYQITEVNGNTAKAVVKTLSADEQNQSLPTLSQIVVPVQAPLENPQVVIYHTHSDESYIPTSGEASKPGNGDIFAVGASFRDALISNGIEAYQSSNQHEPHDINAYHRSRRTVSQLLKQQPIAVFDLHRDSAPQESYITTVNGQNTSRVMIVIGKSNPMMDFNKLFAQHIKAIGDELYPGLMRGIYLGRGDYNQDLYPTALLFEIGAEEITLEEADQSAKCLADIVTRALGGL